LNTPAYQTVPVTCPGCSNRFVSPVLTIIDVAQAPEAKTMFLAGRLNVAVCPQCGHAGMLSIPLVYHDPDKELLFTYLPAELSLPEVEQQRIIGDLTNRVMSSLPPERRKGYLLRPRSFLRLEGMVEAILQADGITPEMLEAQRAKVDLLDRLLRAQSEDSRRAIVQDSGDQLDYEFFQLLTLNIERAQADAQEEAVRQLLELRGQLLEWTATGREVAAREDAIRELGSEISREGLLEKLVAASEAGEEIKVDTMITFARPVIDYVFYQQLTERIEAEEKGGNTERADGLRSLRERVLDVTAEVDAEINRARERANRLLEQILDSDDVEESVRLHLGQIDDHFLDAVAQNLQVAEQLGNADRVQKLNQLGELLMRLVQDSQPPEIQFINRLLTAEYPDGTQALLEANRERIDDQMLEFMELIENDLTESGRVELAKRLAEIRKQAASDRG